MTEMITPVLTSITLQTDAKDLLEEARISHENYLIKQQESD